MNYKFQSVFKDYLNEYISVKKKIGPLNFSTKSYLKYFDLKIVEFGLTKLMISKEFTDYLFLDFKNESNTNRYKKVLEINMFIQYINDCKNRNLKLLPVPKKPKKNDCVYIYSDQELNKIIAGCDNLCVGNRSKLRSAIFGTPLFVRILISTGLRYLEVYNLTFDDFDLKNKILRVLDVKSKKYRFIPISFNLCKNVHRYWDFISKNALNMNNERNLFINLAGKKIGKDVIQKNIKKVINKLNIINPRRLQGSRVHDFRHTFAVRFFESLILKDLNPDSYMIVLKNYLGHGSLESTEYYLTRVDHLLKPNLNRIQKLNQEVFSGIND